MKIIDRIKHHSHKILNIENNVETDTREHHNFFLHDDVIMNFND